MTHLLSWDAHGVVILPENDTLIRIIIKTMKIVLIGKAPVTPNGDATAFVQRSKKLSARCEVAAKYA